ncbi:interleukin-22 [Trichosurus vulpecula]|uniref:interleukin-22 n=1 Tax=Trichosurus vulpecula TaxID=9337 RepID=UPI00186ACE27|nr:interleukin-22 [Trichosurus vulpecula]
METQQLLENFFRKRTLALCFLLMTLLAQGEGASIKPSCKLKKSSFQGNFISNQTISLARMASLSDNDTSTRLLEHSMFKHVEDTNRCYLMKEILNLVLKEVSPSYPQKFEQYLRDVWPYLHNIRNRLGGCALKGNGSDVQRQIDNMKCKLKQLGKNGVIKIISELDLLLLLLQNHCAY